MKRFSTVLGLLAIGLTACDSEGIDRAVPQPANNASVTTPADSTSVSSSAEVSVSDTGVQIDANADTDADATSQDTADTPQPVIVPTPNNDATQVVTPAPSVTEIDNTGVSNNDVNMFGGSGSSDGGNNSDITNQDDSSNTETVTPVDDTADADDTPVQNDAVDTSLSLNAPTTGTTFVSTTSPIRYGGPECSFPNKDENNNLIFNGNCPTVKRAGNVAFGDFLLANNTWNDCASAFANWSQCISVDDSSGKVKARWDYDWGNESDVRGAVWLVKSYPEVIYGVKSPGEYSASTLAETVVATGMPAKVSDLPFYKISYSASSDEYPSRSKVYNGQTINGERNIAIESFFHELGGDCDVNTLVRNGTTSNQRFELMVWVDAGAERLPAAPNDYVTTTTIDGEQYDVYTKPSDREYIAFVAKNSRNTAELNWNSFIEWSREYSHRVNEVFGKGSNTVKIEDSWCLANILMGTEIWWGEGFFQLDDYTIQRTER